jgi:hypothetical protein
LYILVRAFSGEVAVLAALKTSSFFAVLFFLGLSNRFSYIHCIWVMLGEPQVRGLGVVPAPVVA